MRGHFSDLDDATRTALIADADQHTYFDSAFTADGTFTYDPQLVAFNIRYEMRFAPDDTITNNTITNDTITSADVTAAAVDRATAWLTAQGYGHKRLSATITDMATMWS